MPDSVSVYLLPASRPKRTDDPWVVTAVYGPIVATSRYQTRELAEGYADELTGVRS